MYYDLRNLLLTPQNGKVSTLTIETSKSTPSLVVTSSFLVSSHYVVKCEKMVTKLRTIQVTMTYENFVCLCLCVSKLCKETF